MGASAGDELVRRAHLGDGAAMAALYTRHVQAVHAYLVLQETVDAARIVGDAFAAAFASVRSVDGGDRGFRIHVLSHAHELLILEATREPNGGVPPAVLPAVVRRWLRALVPAQRDVIALQVASGLAASEAALVLRLSEPMVDIAQSRALRRLEYAGTGVVSALPLPPNLAVAVARDGGEGAITALVAAAETIPPVIPAAALRARFASVRADASAPAARRGSRVKVVAVVGTTIGKIALGAGIAAATAGGAHVAGVVDLPLLPPVTRVSSTQEINENPTPIVRPDDESETPPGGPEDPDGVGDGAPSSTVPSSTPPSEDSDGGEAPTSTTPIDALDGDPVPDDGADPGLAEDEQGIEAPEGIADPDDDAAERVVGGDPGESDDVVPGPPAPGAAEAEEEPDEPVDADTPVDVDEPEEIVDGDDRRGGNGRGRDDGRDDDGGRGDDVRGDAGDDDRSDGDDDDDGADDDDDDDDDDGVDDDDDDDDGDADDGEDDGGDVDGDDGDGEDDGDGADGDAGDGEDDGDGADGDAGDGVDGLVGGGERGERRAKAQDDAHEGEREDQHEDEGDA